MVEICHSVIAIVADQTVLAEILGMLEDETRVMVGVTGLAFCVSCRKVTLNCMAG